MNSREQFEAWAQERAWGIEKTNGFYDHPRAHEAWSAWKASREAIELQMPTYASTPGGVTFDAIKVLQVIGDAGLKARV